MADAESVSEAEFDAFSPNTDILVGLDIVRLLPFHLSVNILCLDVFNCCLLFSPQFCYKQLYIFSCFFH